MAVKIVSKLARLKLLPYETWVLQIPEPLATVQARLEAKVEPPRIWRSGFQRNHQPYAGTIHAQDFTLRRIIHYRNSFLPQIRGRWEPIPGGTEIKITFTLHPVVLVFLSLWLMVWYGSAVPIALLGGQMPLISVGFLTVPLLMLLIFGAAFWAEVRRSQRELTAIFRDEPEPPARRFAGFGRRLPLIVGLIGGGIMVFSWWQGETASLIPSHLSEVAVCSGADCGFVLTHTFTDHPRATVLAFSADGKILASGGKDKAIKVWDLETGALRHTLHSDSGEVEAMALNADGTVIISGAADRMVRIWHPPHPPQMLQGHDQGINGVGLSGDGQRVQTAGFGQVKRWDLATGILAATIPNFSQLKYEWGPVTLWGNDPNRFPVLALSPDGDLALFDLSRGATVWDLNTNEARLSLRPVGGYLLGAAFSPQGQYLAVQYDDQWRNTTGLKIWDLAQEKAIAHTDLLAAHDGITVSLPMALSKTHLFVLSNGVVKIWNLAAGQWEEAIAVGDWHTLAVSAGGELFAGLRGNAQGNEVTIEVFRSKRESSAGN